MVDTVQRLSAELNLEIDKGSTFRHRITWSSGEEGLEELVDLTDCTAEMHIRPSLDSTTIYHELTTENGGITLGDGTGTIDLYISDEDSAAFDWNEAMYDGLEIIFPTGDTTRILRGDIEAFDESTT